MSSHSIHMKPKSGYFAGLKSATACPSLPYKVILVQRTRKEVKTPSTRSTKEESAMSFAGILQVRVCRTGPVPCWWDRSEYSGSEPCRSNTVQRSQSSRDSKAFPSARWWNTASAAQQTPTPHLNSPWAPKAERSYSSTCVHMKMSVAEISGSRTKNGSLVCSDRVTDRRKQQIIKCN